MAVKARTIAFLFAFAATPLLANNPPGPQMTMAMFSMLPAMALLTAIGGGYAVLRRLHRSFGVAAKTLTVVLAILFGGTNESAAAYVFIGFLIAAIVRAIHMLQWASDATLTDPNAATYGVNRLRMATAAILMFVVGTLLLSVVVAFFDAWDLGNEYRYPAMRKYVAYRLALQTAPSPARTALEKKADQELTDYLQSMSGIHKQKVRIDENGNHFVVYLLPNVLRFPSRPYDRWFSAPTYRADDSGAIRMKYVRAFDWCPPDAAIVDRVTAYDVNRVLAGDTTIGDLSPSAEWHAGSHKGRY